MKELLNQWIEEKDKNEESNFLFIRSLKFKKRKKVDKVATQMHDEVFEKINCLDCGNCCKSAMPILDDNEIETIAEFKNFSVEELKKKYLKLDKENQWTINSLPCPFLGQNNKCQIYPARPKDCREFPHTNKPHFASRSYFLSSITVICPAAYFIVENMKSRIR